MGPDTHCSLIILYVPWSIFIELLKSTNILITIFVLSKVSSQKWCMWHGTLAGNLILVVLSYSLCLEQHYEIGPSWQMTSYKECACVHTNQSVEFQMLLAVVKTISCCFKIKYFYTLSHNIHVLVHVHGEHVFFSIKGILSLLKATFVVFFLKAP